MTERLRAVALASASPRRRELLRALGLDVTIVSSAYDERSHEKWSASPAQLALENAVGKAACAEQAGPPVLLAADTIVDLDGQAFGKPNSSSQAGAMLRGLRGRRHTVHTGYVVMDRRSGRRVAAVQSAQVEFLDIEDAVIDRYVETGEPMDKAGAYGVQGLGALLVSSIAGDFYTVMGLPIARIGLACATLGYELL
ncbi:MAG: septum formation protein Maf [Candidatus Eremiobacteraeota bacterium]|nr:septum formation protein Maf [Candidatus Eremiobacteraeota bacterium]MBC5826352.1 septum formation protein Maf [Candidatus Eremiobacteraeota bacterium]